MKNVNLILYPKWLAPMTNIPAANLDPKQQYLENHACVIHDGRILDILPKEECKQAYSAQFEYNLADHLLLPGLFNGHAHSAMSLMRGFADDHPLMTWLEDYIWPTEGTHVSPDFVKVGTELALCEMLASGVTCFNDMYFFPEVVAQILDTTGLRGCLSGPILEFPTAWGANADEYIIKNTEIIQQYKNHPRISAG